MYTDLESRHEKFFKYSLEPILFYEGGRVVDVNPALVSLLGYDSEDQLIGSMLKDIIHLDSNMRLKEGNHTYCMNASGGKLPVFMRQAISEGGFGVLSITRQEQEPQDALKQIYSVLNAAVDTIVTINERGVIEAVFGAVETMFGYSKSELLGENIICLMPEAYRKNHDEKIRRYTEGGVASVVGYGRDIAAQRKDGSVFNVHLAVCETETAGRPTFTGFIRDISQLKETEHQLRVSEARFRTSFETAGHGMALVDNSGRWINVNNALSMMLGYPVTSLEGAEVAAVIHSEDLPGITLRAAELIDNKSDSFHTEARFYHKNGHMLWCMLSICLARDIHGKAMHFVVQLVDISAQKHTEALLIKAKAEADKANLAKTDFLSNMSHEIRTPLNAILGMSELIRLEGNLHGQQASDILEIEKAGKHLLALITDILDLARIESGRMDYRYESVVVDVVLRECFKLLETNMRDKSILLTYEQGALNNLSLHVDLLRFKQVVLNLLSNAVKYNRSRGEVRVSLAMLDEGRLRICVTDTGFGISPEHLKNLFQPFNRLAMNGSEIEGTGIGLVITKNIIEGMGGQIGVESKEGVGTKFWIDVNLAEQESVVSSKVDSLEVGATPADDQIKVLVVEDNPSNRRLLSQQFSILGVHVDFAVNGKEGLYKWKTYRYDAIFTDINMVEMSGYDLARTIRTLEDRDVFHIPIVAISANSMPADIEKYHDAGMDGYLIKPICLEAIKGALEKYLSVTVINSACVDGTNVIAYPVRPKSN